MNLTRRQRETLAYVVAYTEEHGVAPSVREVAARFKINVNAARQHLMKLVEKQQLVHLPGIARGWIVPRACPHCGGAL